LRVDGDEEPLAAGKDFPFLIQDFGHIGVLSASDANFARLDPKRLVERHGLQVVDGDLRGEGDDVTQFVHFAHGFVQNRRYDTAVAVPGRTGVALAEAKAADEAIALFIVGELQSHTFGIVFAAGKAGVLLHAHELSAVTASRGFLFHREGF